MKLSDIRKLLKVSQNQLAEHLGMTQANVSNYETGRQSLPPQKAQALIEFAKSRGVDLTYDNIYPDQLVVSISQADGAVQPLTQ